MTLSREQKSRKEFYHIVLYPTLFDEFMLLHQCGRRACMKKGVREYFSTKKEALLHSLQIIEAKRNEGFRPNR